MVSNLRITTTIRLDGEIYVLAKQKKINLSNLINSLLAKYFVEDLAQDESEELAKQSIAARISNAEMKLNLMKDEQAKILEEKRISREKEEAEWKTL